MKAANFLLVLLLILSAPGFGTERIPTIQANREPDRSPFTSTIIGATTMDKVKCAFGLPLDSKPFKGKTHAEVAELLDEMGINAVCACPQDAELIRELHLAGIKVYAEMGMFIGKRHWEAHPESRPINARGKPIGEPHPGYCGVCPNQEWLRKEILDKVADRFQKFEYDGLWLDFIRYPGRWEEKKPIVEECCFCDVCLGKFAGSRNVSYPANLKSTEDKAQWILANHRQEWVRFKCETITDFVRQIKKAMARENPRAILGVFNVPWTQDEFDGAVLNHLGQDVKALAGYVDVFSPMVYHRYCRRPMRWIAEYTDWVREATGRPVWPIVQVCDEPKPVRMSGDEVYRTLRTGLEADGSSGVMPFTLKHAVQDPAKLEALRKAFRE